jgi:hypothetical protein
VKDAFSSFEAFILTTFTLQATKKDKGPPAKKAKNGSGAAHAKQSSAKGSKQKKSLSLLPAMPLDVLFEVKKTVLLLLPAHAHRYSNPLRFSRISPPRTSFTFLEQVELSGIL